MSAPNEADLPVEPSSEKTQAAPRRWLRVRLRTMLVLVTILRLLLSNRLRLGAEFRHGKHAVTQFAGDVPMRASLVVSNDAEHGAVVGLIESPQPDVQQFSLQAMKPEHLQHINAKLLAQPATTSR